MSDRAVEHRRDRERFGRARPCGLIRRTATERGLFLLDEPVQ